MERHHMADYDYIIAGSGAAGCVLVYRLSANPANRVLVLEAGPRDSHPLIHMPKGIAKVMADSKHIWVHESRPKLPQRTRPNTGRAARCWAVRPQSTA